MRRAAKRDLTEPAIIDALEQAGCLVLRLDRFDLLVRRGHKFWMIDCKSPGGRPTKSQERLIADGWPLYYANSPEAALEIIR
jgi:hypothetical protein